jgi:hypothetical protein
LISHSFPVPVSRSLQVSLLASQPTESAAGGEPCGEPAISHDSHHVSLVQWTTRFASRHKGPRFKSTGGYLCETGILLLALSRYNLILARDVLGCFYHQVLSWGVASIIARNLTDFYMTAASRWRACRRGGWHRGDDKGCTIATSFQMGQWQSELS